MPLALWQKAARSGRSVLIRLRLVFLSFILMLVGAQVSGQAPGTALPNSVSVKTQTSATRPDWSALTAAQQAALSPLAPAWSSISAAQKRKWIALSQNYPSLSTAEQSTLHGRMTEWAALSPAQRNQARLNFAETKSLSAEEKKAQWEAYQALSPDQKKHLAAGAHSKAVGAAPAVTPLAPNKLATVPVTRSEAGGPASADAKPRPGSPGVMAPRGNASAPGPAVRP